MSVVDIQQGVGAGVCAKCGKSITHPGPDGECVRCLVSFGFLAEDEVPRGSQGDRARLGPLLYAHFEVEVNPDGYPVILGSGAMAATYRARDAVLNSTVALKVISRKLAEDPTARARFLREARAAAQIHHPNVARVTHYGEQDGECFYAMELVYGETLEERVRREGPLPLSVALEVVEQTARGLAAGEECGVIHRDLKPSNLMIESHAGDQLLVKIIDYGVAKVLAAQTETAYRTQAGFIGTPAFASPEQFDEAGQQQIDTRSDIYSLGVTFWYLLTAQMPFASRSIEEVRAKQAAQLPLKQLKSAHVPLECVTLLKSMLALDPAKRPQTARELLTKIRRCCLRFEPVARRRRKRLVLASVGLALTLALVLLANFAYQRSHSSSELDRSIAVLPFESLSSKEDDRFFAIGVQDEILTKLASLADLKVIARTSTESYETKPVDLRTVGRQLAVGRVLEGSVQRSADKVRVNVQLIDTRTNAHLWASSYDRKLDDVFAVQSEIAKTVAEQLQAKISPNEKKTIERAATADLNAFDLYTRAKTLLLSLSFNVNQQPKLRQAVELLNQAVGRDPAFYEAYYQLVYAHGAAYGVLGEHTPARLALTEAALQAATRLRPDAGETHLARAQYLYRCLRDYNGALAELELARRTLPNDPRIVELTGYILRRRGQQEEGVRNLERSIELDPRNPFTLQQLALSYQALRRYPEQAAVLDRALIIVPNDVATKASRALVDFNWKAETGSLHETIDSILAGDPGAISDAADAWFQCALAERDPAAAERALVALGDNPCWGDGPVLLGRSFGEGLLARMMKDEARAHAAFTKARLEQEKIVQARPDYGPPLCVLGLIDAALGRKEEALREGRRAIELSPVENDSIQGSQMLVYFAVIAAWVDEKDTALQYLAANGQSYGGQTVASYGALKLLPFWDALRGDPQFEEMVASLSTKN
jgi:serine/threonine protein kinase/Flp pilus assembly protein TadD